MDDACVHQTGDLADRLVIHRDGEAACLCAAKASRSLVRISKRLLFHPLQSRVRHGMAPLNGEVFDVFQHERRHVRDARRLDESELRAFHVVEDERGTQVFLHRSRSRRAQPESLHVAGEHAPRRNRAEPPRLGIVLLVLRHLARRLLFRAAALIHDADVAQASRPRWDGRAGR